MVTASPFSRNTSINQYLLKTYTIIVSKVPNFDNVSFIISITHNGISTLFFVDKIQIYSGVSPVFEQLLGHV